MLFRSEELATSCRIVVMLMLSNFCFSVMAEGTFDFVIQTTASNQIFSIAINGASGLSIDWGDGNLVTGLSGNGVRSHQYVIPGFHTNKISGLPTNRDAAEFNRGLHE